MIRSVIIDDEPLAREIVKNYLGSFPGIELSQECNDGFEGIKAIIQHQPDIIFLDIQMPKINGFEMLELVEQPPAVIFTTAFDEYAIRAFETNAVDYLLKPFSRERFNKAVQKWLDQRGSPGTAGNANTKLLLEEVAQSPAQSSRVVVKIGGKIKIIPLQDIHYIEAADDYVKIFTKEGQFLKNKTMQFFEKTLDPQQFIRTHRSYMLNISQITRIDPYEKDAHVAVLKDGAKIPVSKTGYAKLKDLLGL